MKHYCSCSLFIILLVVSSITVYAQQPNDLKSLLEGVSQISVSTDSSIGSLVVYGDQAFVVATGKGNANTQTPIIAAARFGKGRIIIFSHGNFLTDKSLFNLGDNAQMYTNFVRWSTNNTSPTIGVLDIEGLTEQFKELGFNAEDTTLNNLNSYNLICAIPGTKISRSDVEAIQGYVQNGGGLILAATSWTWEDENPMKRLSDDFPGNWLTAPAGMIWTHGSAAQTSDAGFATSVPSKLTHALSALDAAKTQLQKKHQLSTEERDQIIVTLADAIQYVPSSDNQFIPRLKTMISEVRSKKNYPTPQNLLDANNILVRTAMLLETRDMNVKLPEEIEPHPTSSTFPGSVPKGAARISQTITINTTRRRMHSTGLYAPAGEIIKFRVPEDVIGHNFTVRIGSHTDTLWEWDKWERMPEISLTRPINQSELRIASPFGGLIYIEVPDKTTVKDFTVKIDGAVPAPYYIHGKTNPDQWRSMIRKPPAPWAELESDKLIITVPSTAVRKLNNPAALMEVWNQVLDLQAELAGIPKNRQSPERIVTDQQISMGSMHSGYPIMTHLDAIEALVDRTKLLQEGWGFFHELGHNHQEDDWTFEGTEEVTNNLFSLYVMEKLCGVPVSKNSRGSAEFRKEQMDKYDFNQPDFEQWKADPWLGLVMYVQLQQAFGWETYQSLFAQYRALSDNQKPSDDDARRDQWMVRFSRKTGRNLGPFFQAWGIPTSEAARASIADLPVWLPSELQKQRAKKQIRVQAGVQEMSILTNQYSAEFARYTGRQFIVTSQSGTNNFHGTLYGSYRNRLFNALDNIEKLAGSVREDNVPGSPRQARYDWGEYGLNIGGPLNLPRLGEGDKTFWNRKDRLFFFTNFERNQTGAAITPGNIDTPTIAGFNKLNTIPGLSPTTLSIFKQFVRPANIAGSGEFICVGEPDSDDDDDDDCEPQYQIPTAPLNINAPNYEYGYNYLLNIDFIQTKRTQHHGSLNYDRQRTIDTYATLPIFYTLIPFNRWGFSYTLIHNFTSNVTNETRLAYHRISEILPTPRIRFPVAKYNSFPNLGLNDIGIEIGPDADAPQSKADNNYQLINNVFWLKGNHALKFGGDLRKTIAPSFFVQQVRGDYQYDSTDRFLRDLNPDLLSTRSVGSSKYYGDQIRLFAFGRDDWRLRPNFIINLGLNYVYQQVPFTARQQTINSLSSVPGILEFNEPSSQKSNFGPQIGLAYSPIFTSGLAIKIFGGTGQSAIRAGFSMAYDVIGHNLYTISLPPQFQTTINSPDLTSDVPNWITSGAIPSTLPPPADPEEARELTSGWIADQIAPYSVVWNLTIQRQFQPNWAVEIGYLGTRGIHLLTQNRINIQPRINDHQFLPTFLRAPSAAEIAALTLTLDELKTKPALIPKFTNAGFLKTITAVLPNGNSTYHGFSAQVTRRYTQGLLFSGAYIWSHLIDDSTSQLPSTILTSRRTTVLTPRRAQDFQNMRAERSNSGLDRRHRFVFSVDYDLPFFKNSAHSYIRTITGGWSISGTYTYETGKYATVLSGVDSNLNNDSAGDRTIINLLGNKNKASTVSIIRNARGKTVGYVADDPTAYYIQAGPGARATAGRNTLLLPGTNNINFSVQKNFAISKSKRFQFQVEFLNLLNHPQYTPGSPNAVIPITTNTSSVYTVGRADFNNPSHIFSSNPRIITWGLQFIY